MSDQLPIEQGTSTEVAMLNGTARGFDHFGMEDALLPRIRLNGKTGRFVSNLDDEERETLSMVPLIMTRSRTLFRGEGDDYAAYCKSPNGDVPTWMAEGLWDGKSPEVCMACPYSQWQEGKQPPECTLFWNFLAVEIDGSMPFVFSVRGTAIKAARKMMTVLKASGRDLFSAVVTFGSQSAGSGSRSYYCMTFDKHDWLSEEASARFAEMYEDYVASNRHIAELLSGMQVDHPHVEDEVPF